MEVLIDKLIRSKRRTLALVIAPDAGLIVRAPQRLPAEVIRSAVRGKLSWILKKQQQARERLRSAAGHSFEERGEFLYLGQTRDFSVIKGGSQELIFENDKFLIGETRLAQAKAQLLSWYMPKAMEVLTQRVNYYARLSGLSCRRIALSDAKRRWGCCGASGILRFNWRLIMAPLHVLDYVVVHELAHLRQRDHSQRFWGVVGSIYPGYKESRRWLKENGYLLRV